MSGARAALLVATYEYEDPGLKELRAPEADAKALAQVLMDAEIAGYNVTMLLNEPHYVVGEAIGEFYQNRRRQDVTLLYFTGHGLKDDDGHLYFAMKNTKRSSLLFTGLAAEQIDAAMEASPSQQKILILDCCYSGAFPAGRTAKADSAVHSLEKLRGRGRVVLTASDATEYAFEGDSIRGQGHGSVFTKYLVEGMRTGQADLDGDGDISLAELYSYAHDKVIEEIPQQRPKKNEDVEGSIVIGRNINWTLPTYLTNAVDSPIARDRLAAIEGLAHLYRVGNPRVKSRVIEQMTLLGDDDSRSVATAAQQWLRQEHPDEAAAVPNASETPSAAEITRPSPPVGAIPAPSKKPAEQPARQPDSRTEREPAPAAQGPVPSNPATSSMPASPPAAPHPTDLRPAAGPADRPARQPGDGTESKPADASGPASANLPAARKPVGPAAALQPPAIAAATGNKTPERPARDDRDRALPPNAAVRDHAPRDAPNASSHTFRPPPQQRPESRAQYPGRTLGIVGLIAAFFCGLVGLIISVIAYRQSHIAGYQNKPALAGIIVGAILLALGVLFQVLAMSGAFDA
jgi:Caspase domain